MTERSIIKRQKDYTPIVENLAEQLVTAYEEINLLYDLDQVLLGVPTPDEVLEAILREAVDIVSADYGFAVLLDESGDDIEIVKEYGILPEKSIEIDEVWDILREVNRSGKGKIVDTSSDTSEDVCSPVEECTLRVPLSTKEEVIGMICLGKRTVSPSFTSMDLKLLTAIGTRTASAIENRRLHAHYLEKQRIEQELFFARSIQEGLFPKICPEIPGLDIAAVTRICTEVGGDYYDFIALDDGREAVVVGDVSGHGTGAALVMSSMRSALRALAGGDTAGLLERLNGIMVEDNAGRGMMMTLFYGVIDPVKMNMIYTNAGHDYPFIIRRTGDIEFLSSNGGLLGIFDGVAFGSDSRSLQAGDVLCLYSDGITERKSGEGEQFGVDRLVESVSSLKNEKADDIVSGVMDRLDLFAGQVPADDDVTLMIIKITR